MIVVAGAVPGRGETGEHRAIADAVLSAASEAGIAKVLIASSSAVYGNKGPAPFSESLPCTPASPYGRDKLVMESVVEDWRARGINACSLRIGNVVGADALLDYARGAQQRIIDVFPDSRGPVRSWIDGKQLAAVLADLVLADGQLPPALNLASDPPFSMTELADTASVDWVARRVAADPSQSLTLDLKLLRAYSMAACRDIAPDELIANWRALKGAA